MTARPFTVTPDSPLFVAASELMSKKINCLPVVSDDQAVLGILTSTDLIKSYQKMVEAMQIKFHEMGLVEFSTDSYLGYAPGTSTRQ
jgi:predicted transcriptional regulator